MAFGSELGDPALERELASSPEEESRPIVIDRFDEGKCCYIMITAVIEPPTSKNHAIICMKNRASFCI